MLIIYVFKVKPFGSFACGLSLPYSDLDMVDLFIPLHTLHILPTYSQHTICICIDFYIFLTLNLIRTLPTF